MIRPFLWKAALAGVLLAASMGAASCFGVASSEMRDYGRAPEFAGIEGWMNSAPLTIAGLRGKVVLVEFWTHECINCLHALPHTVKWYDKYKDQGLVVVGVHTPETEAEMQIEGLQAAIRKFGIKFPVARDTRFATWEAYDNHFWPASYLIDRQGTIVRKHIGEGDYGETESAIRQLLAAKDVPADGNTVARK